MIQQKDKVCDKKSDKINRKSFLGKVSAGTLGMTVIPSSVLEGQGRTTPRYKFNVACFGQGTQGLRLHYNAGSLQITNDENSDAYLDRIYRPGGVRDFFVEMDPSTFEASADFLKTV